MVSHGHNSVPAGINAIFAPDWRDGVPYQALLAGALQDLGAEVKFLSDYRRVLPLTRGLHRYGTENTLLHLHWPEAYFSDHGATLFRRWRHPVDLWVATRRIPLVITAHNLYAHDRRQQLGVRLATRSTYRRAQAVIAHSSSAADLVLTEFGLARDRLHVIPHGDLAANMLPLLPKTAARAQLGLSARPMCLVFGVVAPYKGLEELIDIWRQQSMPADLWIVGAPHTVEYAESIRRRAAGLAAVHLDLTRQSDEQLRTWLAATDAVAFNYRQSLTSGAACLARSLGIPLLLPRRLQTVDLAEPHSHVFRFERIDEVAAALARAVARTTDAAVAQAWREATAWPRIAEATLIIYRRLLARSS